MVHVNANYTLVFVFHQKSLTIFKSYQVFYLVCFLLYLLLAVALFWKMRKIFKKTTSNYIYNLTLFNDAIIFFNFIYLALT